MRKIYKISFSKGLKVSLVKDPAVESTLLKFNSEVEKPLFFANDEKRIIYSIAMIPNKLIFRKDINGDPADVYYDETAIYNFQKEYFRNGNLATNVNHAKENTNGIFPFESWIVEDPKNDKSNYLGLDAPKGSLVMGFSIENEDTWIEVKNGNLDGLSIEGFPILEEETINTINMNAEKNPQTLWDTMKSFFAVEPVAPEMTPKEEAVKEDEPVEVEKTELAGPDLTELGDKIDALTQKIADLETKLIDAEAATVEANTELEKMKSETPASLPIPLVPIEMKKSYNEMTNFEKLKFNRENKK